MLRSIAAVAAWVLLLPAAHASASEDSSKASAPSTYDKTATTYRPTRTYPKPTRNAPTSSRSATRPPQSTITSYSNSSWASVVSCNDAFISWRDAGGEGTYTQLFSTQTYVSTHVATYTLTPTYTLCDGYPRLNGSLRTVTDTGTQLTTSYAVSVTEELTNGKPSPTCRIGSADCASLWSSFSSFTDMAYTNVPSDQQTGYSYSSPGCPEPATTSSHVCGNRIGSYPCSLVAGPVRLVYFPVKVEGDRLCGNYTTVTPKYTATTPVVATALGTTFTSGTAYLSFESLAAIDTCGQPVGTPVSNFFVPLPSLEVSSMRGNGPYGPSPASFNYADLIEPVAASVYLNQAQCDFGFGPVATYLCPVISTEYRPVLAYPSQVLTLQPEWSTCGFVTGYLGQQAQQVWYLFDPPIALTEATAAATATLPPQPAQPGSTFISIPTPTGSPADLTTIPRTSTRPFVYDPTTSSSGIQSPTTLTWRGPDSTKDVGAPQTTRPVALPDSDPYIPSTVIASVGSTSLTLTITGTSAIIAGTKTLKPGDQATVSGIAISVGSSNLVFGSASSQPATGGNADSGSDWSSNILKGNDPPGPTGTKSVNSPGATVTHAPPALPTVTISRSGSAYVMDGTTLAVGIKTVVNGQDISWATKDNTPIPIIGSATLRLQAGQTTTLVASTSKVAEGVITIGTHIATIYGLPDDDNGVVIDGTSIAMKGSSAVIDGATLSLGSAGVIVESAGMSSTVHLTKPTTSASPSTNIGAPAASSASVLPIQKVNSGMKNAGTSLLAALIPFLGLAFGFIT